MLNELLSLFLLPERRWRRKRILLRCAAVQNILPSHYVFNVLCVSGLRVDAPWVERPTDRPDEKETELEALQGDPVKMNSHVKRLLTSQ